MVVGAGTTANATERVTEPAVAVIERGGRLGPGRGDAHGGDGMTLWEEILWGWIVLTILPKLLVIPVWRSLLRFSVRL